MARVIQQYCEEYYIPGAQRAQRLLSDGGERAAGIARWKQRVTAEWDGVRVRSLDAGPPTHLVAGTEFGLSAVVGLGSLSADDVAVQLCIGRMDAYGDVTWDDVVPMEPAGQGDGGVRFTAAGACCAGSGMHGYTIRVLPRHEELGIQFMPGLVRWAPAEAAAVPLVEEHPVLHAATAAEVPDPGGVSTGGDGRGGDGRA
jgi:glycogen phosphorylase